MTPYLEHVNITVKDLDRVVRFLETALPGWRVRGQGRMSNGARWLHVGTDTSYVALQEPTEPTPGARTNYAQLGINHLAFVVDDLDALEARLAAAGYSRRDVAVESSPHRRRCYYFDDVGHEYEFLAYSSDKAEERNAY